MYLLVVIVVSLHLVAGFPSDVHIHLYIANGGEHVGIAPGVMADHYNTPSGTYLSFFAFGEPFYRFILRAEI